MGPFLSSTGGKITVILLSLLAVAAGGYFLYQDRLSKNSSPDTVTEAQPWQIQKVDPDREAPKESGDEPKIIPVDSFDTEGGSAIRYVNLEDNPVTYDELPESASVVTTSSGESQIIYIEKEEEFSPAPPTPTIKSGPSGLIKARDVSFSWEGSSGDYRCSINRPAYRQSVPCSSPRQYRGLRNGKYVFRVWAQEDGNHSPAAARSFQIDTKRPPGAKITAGPQGPTNNPEPVFRFKGQNGLGFLCSIDTEPFRACSSPYTPGRLDDGKHSFRLRTVDKAGNLSRSIKKRVFIIDTVAPATPTITSGPEGETTDTSPVFTFTGEDGFRCSLDSESPTGKCSSPIGYVDLSEGEHIFRVWSQDAAGNRSASAASRTFTVIGLVPSKRAALRASSRSSTLNPSNYGTGDTSSAAGETQSLTLEIDPAIEVEAIDADSDTVSPQAGGDVGESDDAAFTASINLRSNLSWTSTAAQSEAFGLVGGNIVITGDEDTDGSNGTEGVGDGTQNYDVQFSIDISWADSASAQAAPYDALIDHDVSNAL